MRRLIASTLGLLLLAGGDPGKASPAAEPSDPAAVALAESVLERLGGREAWNATRYLTWRFFGRRSHTWDRFTGDVRIESEERLVLMNLGTREGRVWVAGAEVTDPENRRAELETGYAWWVNDSYWLLMPYKMLDPGVRLESRGEDTLEDGRAADVVGLSFDSVGLTPENRYDVWIARDTGLVEQWAFYPDGSAEEPNFVLPWSGWERFGPILLATEHGRGADWEIAVPDRVAPEVFRQP